MFSAKHWKNYGILVLKRRQIMWPFFQLNVITIYRWTQIFQDDEATFFQNSPLFAPCGLISRIQCMSMHHRYDLRLDLIFAQMMNYERSFVFVSSVCVSIAASRSLFQFHISCSTMLFKNGSHSWLLVNRRFSKPNFFGIFFCFWWSLIRFWQDMTFDFLLDK